jgi:hypothetical protein
VCSGVGWFGTELRNEESVVERVSCFRGQRDTL